MPSKSDLEKQARDKETNVNEAVSSTRRRVWGVSKDSTYKKRLGGFIDDFRKEASCKQRALK